MDSDELDTPEKRLVWARENAGFKKAGDFAKRVRIHPTTYRAYENGQNGFAKHAADFADRLGVTAAWLMKGGDIAPKVVEEMPLDHQARQLGLMMVPEMELGYSMGGGSIFNDYRRTGAVPFQREWLRSLIRGSLQDLFVARRARPVWRQPLSRWLLSRPSPPRLTPFHLSDWVVALSGPFW